MTPITRRRSRCPGSVGLLRETESVAVKHRLVKRGRRLGSPQIFLWAFTHRDTPAGRGWPACGPGAVAAAFDQASGHPIANRSPAGCSPDGDRGQAGLPSEWAAMGAVAQKLGIGGTETLRHRVRQAEADAG